MEDFLDSVHLGHLKNHFIEQGVDLDILLLANDHELALLTPRVVDKIKLRNGLQNLTQSKKPAPPCEEVSLPKRQSAIHIPNAEEHKSIIGERSTSTLQTISTELSNLQELNEDWNLQLDKELETLDCQTLGKGGKNLRQLLLSLTVGRLLLKKADSPEQLSSRERAFIAKLIVETELRALQDVSTTIRKNIWQEWAHEVVSLFKGEVAEVYYIPYHVIGGKVMQASGLFHNRLITHRRLLLSSETKKRKSSISSESDSSCSEKYNSKRLRPLPESFNVDPTYVNDSESMLSPQDCFDWLRGSSSPKEVVATKWLISFQLRNDKLLEGLSYKEYFSWFPALTLPDGHELLSLDFQTVYPDANKVFEEKFPIIKTKILGFLAEKGSSSRQDQTTLELLDLATVGEHQASLAAFMGIISLLRQMPTVSVPRKKLWRLSKEEVRSSFIGLVTTASDIERYCADRDAFVAAKGIPSQPYILAVGTSWATVTHYEIVIYTGLRYQMPDVCSAIKKIYHIYWALDSAYPKDSTICWMFIQRAMFNMKSKYDTEGVPLRELLHMLNV